MPGIIKGKPGRPKGSLSFRQGLVRDIVEKALGGSSIPKRLIEMAESNPDIEKDVLIALLPYCHPKLQAIEHSGEIDTGSEASKAELEKLKQMYRDLKV